MRFQDNGMDDFPTQDTRMDWRANDSVDLPDLNIYFMRKSLWPAIIYTAVLMIVGTVGNVFVLIVYRRHFQRSVTRMFIYSLAILDLGNCLITMPAELTILVEFTSFPSPVWCKATRYLTYIFNGTSSFVLIAIALDRYFKVCLPMKTLITIRRAKIICVSSFLLTIILAIPALVIYGELRLPIRVSGNDVSILPLPKYIMKPAILQNSVVSATSRPTSHNVIPQTSVSTTDSRSMRPSESSSGLVYGQFCLLNSKHVDGHVALIFYVTMFVMYVGMVVIVVLCYGKVARAMFVLTSKHSKMFSFNIQNNCTPSSNSFAPEGSVDPCPGSSSKVNEEVSSADNKTEGSSSASTCYNQGNEAGSREHKSTILRGHAVKDRNDRTATKSVQHCNAGYETGDTISNSEISNGVLIKNEDNLSSKIIPIQNNDKGGLGSGSCDSMSQQHKNSEKRNNSTQPTEACSSQPGSKIRPSENCSTNGQNPKSRKKKDKKHTKSKIPKIKVRTASMTNYNMKDMVDDLHSDAPEFSLHPLSTNPLFVRRIKSTENISHLVHLHLLQASECRLRGHEFSDRHDTDNSRAIQQSSSQGTNKSGQGTVNLDYLMDTITPSSVLDKTCTLTKMSSSGNQKRCVLPLRGLTTKAASQLRDNQTTTDEQNVLASSDNCLDSSGVREHQTANNGQPDLTSSDKCLLTVSRSNILQSDPNRSPTRACKSAIFQTDVRLELGQDLSKTKFLTTKSNPEILNSSDLDSVVTLRNRASEMVKSVSYHEGGDKTDNCQVHFNVPRKEIISAAGILLEQHRRHSLHPFRTSRMVFVISLMFVISFLPFFTIALIRSSSGSSFMSMGNITLGVISVFIRSSLISNAINPIVYGFLSTHFRRECAGILGRLFRR